MIANEERKQNLANSQKAILNKTISIRNSNTTNPIRLRQHFTELH